MKIVNLHTHLNLMKNQVGLINHPAQLDFSPDENQYYSVGLHPWDIPEANLATLTELIDTLAANPQVLAIGECGLDRSIETDMQTQLNAFVPQIEIAEKHQKPLIIHAVRSYADLLQLKKTRTSQIPWILHGYNGNPETTRQLVKMDFYFSFGAALLKDQDKLNKSLLLIPTDRLFFETDESSVNIESIYIFAASILGINSSELHSRVYSNFQRVFKR